MVTKRYCDVDGSELKGTEAKLQLVVVHRTNQGEYVGEDEYTPADLCYACLSSPIVLTELMQASRPIKYNDIEERAIPRDSVDGPHP